MIMVWLWMASGASAAARQTGRLRANALELDRRKHVAASRPVSIPMNKQVVNVEAGKSHSPKKTRAGGSLKNLSKKLAGCHERHAF